MSQPAAIVEMIETALQDLGAVDFLINNAGIQHVAPVHEFPVAKWDAIIAINLSAAFHTTRLALQGVTCNAVCPGYVYTPLIEAQIEGQAKAHGIGREQVIRDVLLAQQPNKRFATAEEVGSLCAFLASDSASSITGAAIAIDGGWTSH